MNWSDFWLPPSVTQLGHQIDGLFYLILWITGIAFIVVEAMLVIFLLRYRRRRKDAYGSPIHGNTPLEIIWTIVPAIIFLWLGVISVKLVYAAQTPPANPIVIDVVGHQWYWEFKYPGGLDKTGQVYVPEGRNVEFEITGADVIHGFYVPALRLQQDALPGRLTMVWMNSRKTGTFEIECNQYCGVQHSSMLAPLHVIPYAQWNTWLHDQEHPPQTKHVKTKHAR